MSFFDLSIRPKVILVTLIVGFVLRVTGEAGQTYYSPISIASGQVPSTQTNFPVLVSVTDNRFKTIGNGGHVNNSSGFDIRPYSDTGLTTALSYWLERYNASTGEVVMWVKVASLSSSTTPIYLGYGDTSLTTDGSSGSNTWSNSFISVYSLKDGTTLSVADALGSNNGTNHSATATSGQIDGAASFVSASSQYIDLGTAIHPASITISAWVNGTSFPNSYNAVVDRNDGTANYWAILVKSSGKLGWFVSKNASFHIDLDGTGTNTLSSSTWYKLDLVFDHGLTTGALKGYVNGSQDASGNIGSSFDLPSNAQSAYIGNDPTVSSRFWNGKIDHVAISSVPRSADWITTEYNNQSAPGTFETLGSEVSLTSAATDKFFMFFN